MHIPEPLRAFAAPTYIVATDNVQARVYRADGREIEPVLHLSTKTDDLPGERSAVKLGGGQMSSAEPEDDRQEWSRERLYDQLNHELLARLKNGEFQEVAFTVPQENVELFKESLHIDLLKRTVAFVPKNLVGEDLVDLAAHVQEER